MLPQFGYIVAQAGADAHLPPFQPSLAPPPPPTAPPHSLAPSQCSTIHNTYRLTPPPPPPTHYLPPQPKWHHEPSSSPPPMVSYDLYHAATPWDQGRKLNNGTITNTENSKHDDIRTKQVTRMQ